ncbi:MAG: hypothetical protein OEY04_06690 [Gammaproteobacteria bacterium]|nr:hypothetical protein [Gammaproteobacteria bacterium]
MSKVCRSFVLLWLSAVTLPAVAQDVYVPAELEPWKRWVLHDKDYRDCPFIFNRAASGRDDYLCAWPGTLSISANANGASFSQAWTVYADQQWVSLPGDSRVWPEEVQVDGRTSSVVLRDGLPTLRLGPGRYTVSGRFVWEQRPQTLAIPSQSGLLTLTVDGRRVARPDRNQAGVWLGERSQGKAEQNSLQVQAYRLLSDDVPSRLTTLLTIDVSGSVREELFGPALPGGWTPLSIDSELPAKLEPDGSIRLQLRPGRWQLGVMARADGVMNEVAMPVPKANMPGDEIWSYRSNDKLRVTAVEGSNPADPDQVGVPGEWQELPAFRMQQGDTLTLSERSRGRVAADNRLQIDRQLWLDFNGDGFTYADKISGEMRSEWRLNMAAPFALLNATEAGENLLITRSGADAPSGIEVRQSNVELEAFGRLETRGEFAAAGWDSRVESMDITLNLPPGHRLFAAPGVDSADGSWISQWQLLDFFVLLIITIATARLFGNAAGAIALLALTLSLHESGSAAWSWLNLLAAVALVRVAPDGRLATVAKAYRSISLVALLVIIVPFMVGQIRDALYPQLEVRVQDYRDFLGITSVPEDDMYTKYPASAPAESDASMRREMKTSRENMAVEEIIVTGARISKSYSRYADNAVVQAGPGRPDWTWNRYELEFSGPVDTDRTMRLVVIPDWLVSVLRFIAVFAIAAFAGLFAFETSGRKPRWNLPGGIRIGNAASSAALLLMACTLFATPDARAETPSAQILQELERRLLAAPDCAPRCAEMVTADVRVSADSVSMELTMHALENVAMPLPGSMDGWRAERISVNGSTAVPVYRGDDGGLWIQLRPGQSSVSMQGPLPPVASLEIPFLSPPRTITTRSDGWFLAGVRERRLLSGSLQLTRLQQESDETGAAAWEMSRLPLFVRVERQLEFDLDWRVNTTVYRIAPQQGALSIDLPLLDGESIVSADFKVIDNKVQVSMNPGAQSVSWNSTLPRKSPLVLSVASGVPWSEVWRLAVGSVWHAEFEGVPESETGNNSSEVRIAEFYPRGGESLTVYADRPEGVSGNTLAFDQVTLQTTLGARTQDVSLALQYRSTRGAQHVLTLPADAEVISVVIDGRTESLRANGGELSLPILPGEHSIEVDWRSDSPVGFRARTPRVDLGAEAGNITLGMEVPDNRWVLFASGPDLGPAVLYWSELAALILLALVLGRIDLTPLGTRQWILLGLGFSTFSWGAFAVVAVWLLSSGARHRFRLTQASRHFNLLQIGFALLSIAALFAIVTSLPAGLLGTPDMHIDGYRSFGNSLHWFADRSASVLPQASALTAPLWFYKALILVWALWLSFALLRWLPWVWQAFVQEGLWRPRQKARGKTAGATGS